MMEGYILQADLVISEYDFLNSRRSFSQKDGMLEHFRLKNVVIMHLNIDSLTTPFLKTAQEETHVDFKQQQAKIVQLQSKHILNN